MAGIYSVIFTDEKEANYAHPISYFVKPECIETGDFLILVFGNNNSGSIVFTEINLLIHQFDAEGNQLGKIEKVVTPDDVEFYDDAKETFVYRFTDMDPKVTHGVITFKAYVDEEGLVHKLNKDYCFALADHIKAEYEAFMRGEYVKFNYLETEPKMVCAALEKSAPQEEVKLESQKEEVKEEPKKNPAEMSEEERERRLQAILNGEDPDAPPVTNTKNSSYNEPEEDEMDINDIPTRYPKSVILAPILVTTVVFALITIASLVDIFIFKKNLYEYSSTSAFGLAVGTWVLSGCLFLFAIAFAIANPRKAFEKLSNNGSLYGLVAKNGGTKAYVRKLYKVIRTMGIILIVIATLCFFIFLTIFSLKMF